MPFEERVGTYRYMPIDVQSCPTVGRMDAGSSVKLHLYLYLFRGFEELYNTSIVVDIPKILKAPTIPHLCRNENPTNKVGELSKGT